MKLATRLACLYFVVPIIFVALTSFGSGYHPSGDCGDPTWNDTPYAAREEIIKHQTRFDAPVSKIMIIVGIILLGALAYSSIKSRKYKQAGLPVFLVLLAIAGYSVVIAVMHGPWCK